MSPLPRGGASIPDDRDGAAPPSADPDWGRFVRGLTLGALVGAAIAGSAIWDRLRRRDDQPADTGSEESADPA